MKYSEARPKIKSGDVLAWTYKKWGTWYDFQVQMVRCFTQSEYTHVGVAKVEDDGRVYVLESVNSGIRKYPLSEDIPFFWLPVDVKWNLSVEEVAMSKMGQPYSKWDGIVSLFHKIKPGYDNRWECAEYVSFILQSAGITIDCRNVPSSVVEWLQYNLDAHIIMVTRD